MATDISKALGTDPAGVLEVDLLVVGAGIAGMTTAIEAAELDRRVVLIEKQPYVGGRVITSNQYFPKLCPPTCGLEINLKRIRSNPQVTVLTLAEVTRVSGQPGEFSVDITLQPRYVNDQCTACGECAKVCEIERDNDFNFGIDKTKAIYLPHLMAYPPRYVVDPRYAGDERMKKCVEACAYGAIELDMQPQTIAIKAGAIVWATGWRPYDATRMENLGFGRFANVLTNVMMERYASESGPTGGRVLRPSDGAEPKCVGFVQCAGSRDDNHLPYCSSICCLASMKQATYVRERYPDAEIHLFYIDVRAPGRMEDFYERVKQDEKFFFHRGKVGKITEQPETGNLTLEAEDTLTGQIARTEVDLAILATGMVPNTVDDPPPLDTRLDDYGFLVPDANGGVVGAGTAVRPVDVATSVQDATGAVLKALNMARGR
jgi:quinone-modifying oxidoreductase subunit QmoA